MIELREEFSEEMTIENAISRLKAHREFLSKNGFYTKKAIDVAIEALKKQIPLKPIVDYKYPENLRKIMVVLNDVEEAECKIKRCPICENPLKIFSFIKKLTNRDIGDAYCKWCGQAILWGEEEG